MSFEALLDDLDEWRTWRDEQESLQKSEQLARIRANDEAIQAARARQAAQESARNQRILENNRIVAQQAARRRQRDRMMAKSRRQIDRDTAQIERQSRNTPQNLIASKIRQLDQAARAGQLSALDAARFDSLKSRTGHMGIRW